MSDQERESIMYLYVDFAAESKDVMVGLTFFHYSYNMNGQIDEGLYILSDRESSFLLFFLLSEGQAHKHFFPLA